MPNVVRAKVGDVVQFQFSSGNHTVTQSLETEGCQPLQAKEAGALHSGHIPFQDGQTEVGTFSMVVQSTDPMFLYCATGPHCQTGQVMVINPYVVGAKVLHDHNFCAPFTNQATAGQMKFSWQTMPKSRNRQRRALTARMLQAAS